MVIYGIGMSALIVSMMLIYGIKIITSGRAEIINNAESITAQYTSKLNHDMNGLTSSVISIYGSSGVPVGKIRGRNAR